MSLYSMLLKIGHTHESIMNAAAQFSRSGTRSMGLVVVSQPVGVGGITDPLVGVGYRLDYRAEEEWGSESLVKALCDEPRWDRTVRAGAWGWDFDDGAGGRRRNGFNVFKRKVPRQVARVHMPGGESVGAVAMVLTDAELTSGRPDRR